MSSPFELCGTAFVYRNEVLASGLSLHEEKTKTSKETNKQPTDLTNTQTNNTHIIKQTSKHTNNLTDKADVKHTYIELSV